MTFQELLAAQVASGGQNVITPDNAGRILGLAAQQEANRRLALAEGQQAVQERKNLQAMQAGETPGVVAAPSGAKFVYDAQGNIVGTNAPIGIGTAQDKREINRGQATAQERTLLGPAIREAFMLEMQKPTPKQPAKVEEKVSVQETPLPVQPSPQVSATSMPTKREAAIVPAAATMSFQDLMAKALETEQGVSTPEQNEGMRQVANKRREEMAAAAKLQEALQKGDRAGISRFRKEMERLRKEMLDAREKAYPGSTTAMSPTERLKERMLLQD